MTPEPRETFFATCAPGLEPLLHAEVRALKLAHVERQVGGVLFEGSLRDAMRANLWLRTATRVLLRVARFEARDEDELYRGAGSVDWSRFLRADGRFVVGAHSNASKLDHTLFIEQRVKDALVDRFRAREGRRPDVDKDRPELAVHVHLVKDRCTLLADTSGESLHKRGWRRYQGRAPLSETLAAALVQFSGWDLRSPLVDPFCGGGTILVEAALLARNVAPGSFRERFAFQGWPGHDAAAWESCLREAARARSDRRPLLEGRDWDPATLEGARQNLAGAGLEDEIELSPGAVHEWEPRKGWNAWIVTNPPYGERVGSERAVAETYRRFDRLLAQRCRGYRLALLTSERRLAETITVPGLSRRALLNGPLECVLLTGTINGGGDPPDREDGRARALPRSRRAPRGS